MVAIVTSVANIDRKARSTSTLSVTLCDSHHFASCSRASFPSLVLFLVFCISLSHNVAVKITTATHRPMRLFVVYGVTSSRRWRALSHSPSRSGFLIIKMSLMKLRIYRRRSHTMIRLHVLASRSRKIQRSRSLVLSPRPDSQDVSLLFSFFPREMPEYFIGTCSKDALSANIFQLCDPEPRICPSVRKRSVAANNFRIFPQRDCSHSLTIEF